MPEHDDTQWGCFGRHRMEPSARPSRKRRYEMRKIIKIGTPDAMQCIQVALYRRPAERAKSGRERLRHTPIELGQVRGVRGQQLVEDRPSLAQVMHQRIVDHRL